MSNIAQDDYQEWLKAIKGTTPLSTTDKVQAPTPEVAHYPSTPPETKAFQLVHDLHGMTHNTAYDFLKTLIQSAYEENIYELRIITGKSGELKRWLPLWMKSPAFSSMVKKTHLEYTGGSYLLTLW